MELYKDLLLNRISNLSKFEKRPISIQSGKYLHLSKIERTIDKLKNLSILTSQPIALVINTFADYLVSVAKAQNLNSIYLKVLEFCNKIDLGSEVFSSDNIETAYLMESIWNKMNSVNLSQLPLQIRRIVNSNRVYPGFNTFFVHSSDFLKFVTISKFIDDNRKTYPFISGFEEFFLHLPVMRKHKDKQYYIYHYLNSKIILDKYYQKYYSLEDGSRWVKFLSVVKKSPIKDIENNLMFGIKPYLRELNTVIC